mmetsp:Transcript_2026/g.3202  ORF Transcript_2026/g.3202 Transcript_2026/m.3202 type:complete len:450 (-) Transcript_2026:937-2286(-)
MIIILLVLLHAPWIVDGISILKCQKNFRRAFCLNANEHSIPVEGVEEGMKMRYLPNTEVKVSELCLGTMMFGDQIKKTAAFELLDIATKECGINFVDTSEIYPMPSTPETVGHSELIIGEWLKQHGKTKRSELVISTKICGFSNEITWCRKSSNEEGTRLTSDQITEAVNAQLKRLGTDYIDVLQFNWPDRYVPLYGAPEYLHELEREDAASFQSQLEAVDSLVKAGKVRHFGLSNETPYGATSFMLTAEALGLSHLKPVTVQNAYNLLERNDFESGMLEVCSPRNGNLGLLAYSPLAGGALTGKYLRSDAVDMNSRMRQFVGYMYRYIAPPATAAIREYQALADYLSLPLGPLALAFVYSRPFVTSTIIGATTPQQLRDNVMALNLAPLSDDALLRINEIYQKHRDPSKGAFEVIDPNLEYIDPSKLPWGAKDQDVDPELDIIINQRL